MFNRAGTHDTPWLQSQLMSLLLATGGAVALALLSQIKLYLPGNPVPMTFQVLAVLLLAGLLGPRLAVAAVVEYLFLGLIGLPVFAGWTAGWATMTGATCGYLIGFLIAAYVAGMLYERVAVASYARRVAGAAVAGIVGAGIIYLSGMLWLSCWGHMTLIKAFTLGVQPFIILDILKVSAAATGLALRRKGAA